MTIDSCERRIAASQRARCTLVAALGCIAVVLSAVQSPLAYGQVQLPGGYTYYNLGSLNSAATGSNPYGSLTLVGTTLCGMTNGGGPGGSGGVFSISTIGGAVNTLYAFSQQDAPYGSLTRIGSTLYGMTSDGGTIYNSGDIFSITTAGSSSYNELYDFTGGTDGSFPQGSLTASPDGKTLYGMTSGGGTAGQGNVFSYSISASTVTTIVSFTGTNEPCPGSYPSTNNLTLSPDGKTLYGMTQNGGTNGGNGVVFSVGTSGSNYQNLHSFNALGTDGNWPAGGVTLVGQTLYGMTQYGGGAVESGSIFSIGANGSGFQNLVPALTGTGGTYPGSQPWGSMTLVGSTLYGMTSGGGANSRGTIFAYNTNTSSFSTIYSFKGSSFGDGSGPTGDLTASGAWLYGMTNSGGDANGDGAIFSLLLPAAAATANATLTWAQSGTFGAAVSQAPVAAAATYAGLASYVNGVSGGAPGLSLGATATIGGGLNSSTNPTTVSFAWRTRAPNESSDFTATSPPMGHSGSPGGIAHFLASDVLQVTGMSVVNVGTGQTDAYGLSLSYNAGLVGTAAPYLATLLPNGYWMNAINGDIAGAGVGTLATSGTSFTESLADFMIAKGLNSTSDLTAYVGDWGYDTTTQTAWAIVDFQSDPVSGNYAFAVVPEPGTIVLLLAGGLVLLPALRRRLRRA